MDRLIITNNELVYTEYKDTLETLYLKNYNYIDVLKVTRDKIHRGHKLYTHPLAGSIKANDTPYKSILISKYERYLDEISLRIIENSIQVYTDLLRDNTTPLWTKEVLDQFMIIDLSIIKNSII
ncbi:GrdX family protein [Paraclostridium sordellii]|uniref:GrdX family protein n=1 Tax=Paraclostridium sordellii TaxID=1505 RepID=UPI003A7F497C